MGMPYKCPPAPFEASLIIDQLLSKNGTRQSVSIAIYSPAPIALPVAGPKISSEVVEALYQRGIEFHPSCKIRSVSAAGLEFENGSTANFTILIGIPPHVPPQVVRNSDLAEGNPAGWISVQRE